MASASHCGLDFGTSNSTIGLARENGPHLISLEDHQATLPSVLFFSFEDGETYFGRKAILEYAGGAGGRLMRSLKSVLGTSLMNDVTRVQKRRIGFGEIIETFVSEIKRRAEAASDQELNSVVVGRPVHFVDDDEAADQLAQSQLEAAVRAAGFSDIAFQFEPIAAALDYEQTIAGGELAMVVDIGGGTSDFTLIHLSPDGRLTKDRSNDILSTAGVHVGGTDFDQQLSFRAVMPLLGMNSGIVDSARLVPVGPYHDLATWHRINRLYAERPLADLRATMREADRPDLIEKMIAVVEAQYGHALAGEVEALKIALTTQAETLFEFAKPEVRLSAMITKDQFDRAIAEKAEKISTTIEEMLRQAGVNAEQVQTVMMTGGSTQIPFVRSALDTAFPAARFVQTDAFGSVGTGLALEAKKRFS